MLIDGDTAAVVANQDVAVLLNRDPDVVAEAGHRLIDGVVHDLDDQVMEAALVRAADVHARAAPDRLQPFEDLDITRGVIGRSAACLGVSLPSG